MPKLPCKACGGTGISSKGSTCICKIYYEKPRQKPKKGAKAKRKMVKKSKIATVPNGAKASTWSRPKNRARPKVVE